MFEKIKQDLSLQIVLAVILSAIIFIPIGSSSMAEASWVQWLSGNVFELLGSLFMNALKMLILPLVIMGLLTGIVNMSDLSKMKSLALWSVGLYLITTMVALVGALSMAIGFDALFGFDEIMAGTQATVAEVNTDNGGLAAMFASIVPSNVISAMYDGNMLGVIFFIVLLGIATVSTSENIRSAVASGADKANEIVLTMTTLVMKFAPIGIFGLMAKTFINNGVDTLMPLLSYVLVLLCMLILHCFVTYGVIVKLVGGLNPFTFFSKMREIWLFGFSTGSSSATIPVTLKTVEKRMGVQSSSASFTIPLGATINMDGTAVMQGIATIFIAAIYGIDLTFAALTTVVVTATMASIGTAGVRGLIMLSMVFSQVGLPAEGIALLMAVDPILDMVRTAVNLTGDAAVTVSVANRNNMLDKTVFDTPISDLLEKEEQELENLESKLQSA